MSNIYTAGLNNVGSYQVSGAPFASGSIDCSTATKIQFPYVTRWVIVANNDNNSAAIGFSEEGVDVTAGGTNYFLLGERVDTNKPSTTGRLELKLSEIWVSGSDDISIIAGLTNLPISRVDNIAPSGSNWSGSVGVG